MPLNKQAVHINFSQGLETKTDKFQVPLGKFLSLQNSIFSTGGQLTKRNGYASLTSLPDSSSTYLTTFNGDLTAVGSELLAYSSSQAAWVNQSNIEPLNLSALPLIRNNTNQSQAESAVSPQGLVCTVYTDQNTSSLSTPSFKYVVADSTTGQNIVEPTVLTEANTVYGTPRVFMLQSYFIIVYISYISSTYTLRYIALNITNPSSATAPQTLSTSVSPSASGLCFDGDVYSNSLYLAWNGAAASGIKMTSLTNNLQNTGIINPDAAHIGDVVAVKADQTDGTIWAFYYGLGATSAYALALNAQLHKLSAFSSAIEIITSGTITNLTGAAQNGSLTFFYEVANNYSYDSSVATHYVKKNTINEAGTVGTASTLLRGVGLASKGFILDGTLYVCLLYSSPFQSSYFLADSAAQIVSRFAYQNASGYYVTGLTPVTVTSDVAQLAYLFKDLIQAVNSNSNTPSISVNGIYAQTGINLMTLSFGTQKLTSAEIGTNLNLTGGFTLAYDGYTLSEQNFFLYPDSIKCVWNATSQVTPTGDTTSGSNVITSLSANTGIAPGMTITGTAIPANTLITAVGTTTLTLSAAATGNHATETLTIQGNIVAKPDSSTNTNAYYYQVTYEWSDNQGNLFRSTPSIPVAVTTSGSASSGSITVSVPTLRLSLKNANNPVKICIYRWSVANQIYYQTPPTYISSPILNDPTVDSITFVDVTPDANIIGDNILYTNGGVLENISPPAFDSEFLFDSRLWGIVSEDKNLLWYSKQVIEATPVEMSDLLTLYVPPTLGAQGSTGVLTCGAAMDDKLILFKASAMNYINGVGPDNTGANNGYSQPTFITSTVGCSNQNSIVFQPEGLMFEFASESGNQIWILGRNLGTAYIGAPVEAYTSQATVQSAVSIPGTNQVRFTLSSGITLMYDYYYQQWGTFVNVPAVSSVLYQGYHTYIDSFGRVFQESPGTYLDGANPVLMSFTTSWINVAGLQGYQRAYFFYLMGQYLSPHFLNLQMAYDYNPAVVQQSIIQPDNFAPNYGDSYTYGSLTPYAGGTSLEQWKIYLTRQRCQSFRIALTEIYNPALGISGAGFTLSGLNLVIGVKKGYRPTKFTHQAGSS